jgi:hypothetical protein
MKNLYLSFCVVLFLFLSADTYAQCADGRYQNKIFSFTGPHTVQYGSAVKYDGTTEDLMVDIYQPQNDNFAHRPLMVLAFGGSFTSGLRQSPDMVQICEEFAQRGFVCASIDYRLGVANGDDSCIYQAVIRGIQDMNAALRFFYKDAYTTNTYRIDTTQIFCGGTSAGAFIGLNKAYYKNNINDFSRLIPQDLVNAQYELGGTEGNSGNPGYSDNVKGVVDLCGAIFDTLWIQPGDPILIGVHGTGDSTVPYYYDSIEGVSNIKKNFFGGGNIIERFHHLGLNNANDSIYTFIGAPHAPFVLPVPLVPPASLYMDTTIGLLANYMYLNIVCDSTLLPSGINDIAKNLSVSAFPNPSDGQMTIISHEPRDLMIEIVTLDGRQIEKMDLPSYSTQTIRKEELSAGMYLLNYYDAKGVIKLRSDKIVFY